MADPDLVDGTCGWCGDEGAVWSDNGRCENCDGDVTKCRICDEDQHHDDCCRHVFRDVDYEWAGSGIGEPTPGVKAGFGKLLSAMPDGFAADLRAAIETGLFHTWLIAPMIGGGGILEMRGRAYFAGRRWGDALIELGESAAGDDDALTDGYSWLVSLFDEKTPAANRATVAMIDEWAAKWNAANPADGDQSETPSPDDR